jgi:IclR-like helix-turn-helix domain-containing protein
MAGEPEERFWLALSDGQVQDLVLQEAMSRGAGRGLVGVLLALSGVGRRIDLEELMRDERYHDRRISQSVIRGLLVLSAFSSGEVHGLNSLAARLGMGSTTLWRYLKTWVVVGVLEERKDRRYQLARHWERELPRTVDRGSAGNAR